MFGPTVRDVAEDAQVSVATVDRVLNRRGGVSKRVTAKVEAAVARTGYVRNLAAADLSRRRIYRFAFVVPSGDTGFAALMRKALEAARLRLARERIALRVVPTLAFDVAAQVAVLRGLDCDAVAVMASEAPGIEAEFDRLRAAGVRVVTLVADLPRSGRDAYVGLDNVAAGRTAADFMGRFVHGPGTILMIAGSLSARDHTERLAGFRDVMAERFGRLALLPPVEGRDDAATVERLVRSAEGPLGGIYAIGAGNRGLIRALRRIEPRPATIVHELTPTSRDGLREGMIDLVLDQDCRAQVGAAVALMRALTEGGAPPPAPERTRLVVYGRENLR